MGCAPRRRKSLLVPDEAFLQAPRGWRRARFAKLPDPRCGGEGLRVHRGAEGEAPRKGIAKGTVRSSVTPIRAFCLMNRMKGMDWAIISKAIPTSRKYASDRAPTLEEVKLLLNHCPLRLKAAILMQVSGASGRGPSITSPSRTSSPPRTTSPGSRSTGRAGGVLDVHKPRGILDPQGIPGVEGGPWREGHAGKSPLP